jgi:PAS domain S-box-containing protein
MSESVNVLFIEDNPGDVRLVKEELSLASSTTMIHLECVDRLEDGLERLASKHFEAILLDLSLPDSDGLDTLQRVLTIAPAIPVIVMTGQASEAVAMQAVQAGAQDYLIKGQVDGRLITRSIQYAIHRKRAEEALRESEERLSGMIGSAMDAIVTIDEEQRITLFNPAAEQMFHYSAAEAMGQPLDFLLPEPVRSIHREHVRLFGETRLTRRAMGSLEPLSGLRADGEEFPIEASISQLESRDHKFYTVILRDITERKRAEKALQAKNEQVKVVSQQLWQAAKLATMGELAASIAHELNNPLATVSLRAEMLQARFSPDEPESRSIQIIDSEIKRMSSLVANLLQFSRRSSSQISTIKVNEEVANTLELIQYHLRKNSILTVQELSFELPLIQADRQQLRQVFLNLFTNAADAMPLGGMLTIRTWSGEKPKAGITAPFQRQVTASLGLPVSDVSQVFIEVSDTGEGILPDRLERIWEPFYTTKPEGKGTGLGLAICRRIIQEHGGTIEVTSDGIPGKGTSVRISLPVLKER